MLEPDVVADLYTKNNNDPRILQKLVEKGSSFDKDVIVGIYGKKNNHYL
jgi:hypothetical protein